MVSKTDLVRARWENGDTAEVASDGVGDGMHIATVASVGDIMMPLVFTLREDEPLARAAAVMSIERVHHLPVVAADGRVVGMLSSLDFVCWIAAAAGFAS
jgi:CBS domain-containing protein